MKTFEQWKKETEERLPDLAKAIVNQFWVTHESGFFKIPQTLKVGSNILYPQKACDMAQQVFIDSGWNVEIICRPVCRFLAMETEWDGFEAVIEYKFSEVEGHNP